MGKHYRDFINAHNIRDKYCKPLKTANFLIDTTQTTFTDDEIVSIGNELDRAENFWYYKDFSDELLAIIFKILETGHVTKHISIERRKVNSIFFTYFSTVCVENISLYCEVPNDQIDLLIGGLKNIKTLSLHYLGTSIENYLEFNSDNRVS